uniref:Carboxylic ester hydrolase n=2 Tax=Lygus hesperus TaxID=30085 RepID=A0A0K8STH4_LYGHE
MNWLASFFGRLLIFVISLLTPPKRGTILVETPNGILDGYTLTSRAGRSYYAFSGVPYGQPPVGPLRFKDPLPAEPWSGVKQAKTNIKCVEFQFLLPLQFMRFADGQEDCLALSIYTHDLHPQVKKPVLFYIHGGAFEFRIPPGSWMNPTYFMDHDIVVVVVSYRLSVLGFLSFEDETLPGNMGIKDQNLALKWVYENIQLFGGDPKKITVMGESAGGASTHYHSIMPKSSHMIRGAIMQSGTAYNPWAYDPPGEGRKRAESFAKNAGCFRSTTKEILECLRKMDAKDLVALNDRFRGWFDRDPLVTFKPVTEKDGPNAFITGTPNDWAGPTVPVLAGFDDEDGLLKSSFMLQNDYDFNEFSRKLPEYLPKSLMFASNYTSDIRATVNKFLNYYFGSKRNFTREDEKQFSQFYSDLLFRYPLALSVGDMQNDLYLYVNQFPSKNIYIVEDRVYHVQEIFFQWEMEAVPNLLRLEDLEFSKWITRAWANFVINGNPNTKGGPQSWKKSSKSWNNLTFYSFKVNGNKMRRGLFKDQFAFLRGSGMNDRIQKKLKDL